MSTSFDLRKWMGLASMFLLVVSLTAQLRATTVSVGCAGSSGTFDFTSVNDALASLATMGKQNHAIIVSGTCTETIALDDWDNLLLFGNVGAGIFAPADPGGHIGIIEITHSKKIAIRGLKLHSTGSSGPGPIFVLNSSVDVFQCTLENGGTLAGGGMFVQGDSNVHVHASVIQNNDPNGVRVDGPGFVEVGDVSTALEPTPSIIQGNGVGLEARNNGIVSIHGKTIIQNNALGVEVSGGQAVFCCDDGQRQVLNNQIGIFVITGGRLETIGPVLVQGNTAFGIALRSGSATIGSDNTIQENGIGIQARGNSHLQLSSGKVINNSSTGIVIRDNSSAIIADEVVSDNAAGILALILSSVQVTGTNTVTGNRGTDLACRIDSFGYGERTAIGTLRCAHFDANELPEDHNRSHREE